MKDPGRPTPGEGDTYTEERIRRLRRRRLLGFAVCVALWVISVVPLARDATDGREGASVVVVYLVAGAISLGAAAVIRGVYVLLRQRRQFWSPWLFVLAALLAVMGYAVQSAGDEAIPIAQAGQESRVEQPTETTRAVRLPTLRRVDGNRPQRDHPNRG